MKNKIVCSALLLFILITVVILAFQTPEQTFAVSETFRGWATKLGYTRDALEFRSDIHLLEYFIVGFAAAIFSKTMEWGLWKAGIFGCCFGLFEETLKISLPTREFGSIDLVKDFIGVWIAVLIVWIFSNMKSGRLWFGRNNR